VKLLSVSFLPLLIGACSADARTFDPHDPRAPLHLVRSIGLPHVSGRADHMALDPRSKHLFVAEYGNGSVDEIDLGLGKVVGRIAGLHEPQGVAWLPRQQEIAVASGDGLVGFYRGSDRQQVASLKLGDDADNVRVDERNGNLVVGYGSGALAVVDPAIHRVIRQLRLPGHPEAFELLGGRAFVNVPDARAILIGDLDRGRVLTKLSTGTRLSNYPMAANASGSRIAVAYRVPGTLSVMDAGSGASVYSAAICGDADDLYFHRDQVVVICGSGAIELIDNAGAHAKMAVATQRGARTGLLDPAADELYVAVPAGRTAASIWELSFGEVQQRSR